MYKVERASVAKTGECTEDEAGSAEDGQNRMGCERREGGRKDQQPEIQTTAIVPIWESCLGAAPRRRGSFRG
jgi:hypothetical protein